MVCPYRAHATSSIKIRDAVRLAGAVLNRGVTLNVTLRSIDVTCVRATGLVRGLASPSGRIISCYLHRALRILCACGRAKVVVVLERRSEKIAVRYRCRIAKSIAIDSVREGIGVGVAVLMA